MSYFKNTQIKEFSLWVVLFFGFLQGFIIVLWGIKGTVFSFALVYFYILFRWPHISILFSVIFIFDGLALINPNTVMRIPGVFKLKDLFFVSLFLPLLFSEKWKKRIIKIFENNRVLILAVITIILIASFQMVRSSLQFGIPLKSCIMEGRHYWYYAFLPLTAIYIDNSKNANNFFNAFLGVISLLAMFLILQVLILRLGGGRFLSDNVQINPSSWGPFQFARIYPPGDSALVLGFCLSIWIFFVNKEKTKKIYYFLTLILCALAVLLMDSRMRWLHSILVMVVPIFFLRSITDKSIKKSVHFAFVSIILAIIFLSVLQFYNPFISGITKRAFSGLTDITQMEGTWKWRIEDSEFRIKLIKDHPILGVGMIHPLFSHLFGIPAVVNKEGLVEKGITTPDSGIITLLVNFGIVGVIWAAFYYISILKVCSQKLKSSTDKHKSAIALSIMAYMTAGVIVFVTLGLFTWPADIISCSIVLGILASGQNITLKSKSIV